MKTILLATLALASISFSQEVRKNIPYVENGHARHVLDIYAPANAKNLPVVFWMHGGGWQQGDKSSVQTKPNWFMERGFIFVSTNYRLLGAQLAAILCTDDRYLKEVGADFSSLIGCVPVDGDTYNVPAIIEVAETRARVHGFPLPSFGHRLKFGNDPALHKDLSAVTHVAKGKGIPPFLILYVSHHPDNTAQARHFGDKLKSADVPVTLFGARDTEHVKLNSDLGLASDPATKALEQFVASLLK
jgi:arylformamidase